MNSTQAVAISSGNRCRSRSGSIGDSDRVPLLHSGDPVAGLECVVVGEAPCGGLGEVLIDGCGGARRSKDLQGLLDGGEIVGGDEDRGRVTVTRDGNALMGAFDLRDVPRRAGLARHQGVPQSSPQCSQKVGQNPTSFVPERRDADRDRCAPGCPCSRWPGTSRRCLGRALPDSQVGASPCVARPGPALEVRHEKPVSRRQPSLKTCPQ